jgi:hypothetical protein
MVIYKIPMTVTLLNQLETDSDVKLITPEKVKMISQMNRSFMRASAKLSKSRSSEGIISSR